MSRTGGKAGFWVFVILLICAFLVSGFVFLLNVNAGEAWGTALSFALAVLFFFGFPLLSAAITAYLARRMGAPLSPWLWAVLGVLFPVVAVVAVLVVAVANRSKVSAATGPFATQGHAAAPSAPAAPPLPTTKRCPYCGSAIGFQVQRCPNCAAWQ